MEDLTSVLNETQAWAQAEKIDVVFSDEVTSTNDLAKQKAGNDPDHLRLYLCDHQTSGRGRGERTWLNGAAGTSLLSSWSFPTETPPKHITGPLLGLSLYLAAKEVWPNLEWSLKAPNDLYLNDKKLAGILAESMSRGSLNRLVIGIGFNVMAHPDKVETATHLTSEWGLGRAVSKESWRQFLTQLRSHLESAVTASSRDEIADPQRDELLKALNANPHKEGVILEVSPQGDLVMEKKTISWQDL